MFGFKSGLRFHCSIFFLLPLLLLTGPASGDFIVYSGICDVLGLSRYLIYGEKPRNCEAAFANSPCYWDQLDLSDAIGVICEDENDGNGCHNRETPSRDKITRLEMNVMFGHYTFYRDWEGGPLVTVDNEKVGNCSGVEYPSGMTCGSRWGIKPIRWMAEAVYCDSDIGTENGTLVLREGTWKYKHLFLNKS